MLTRVEQFLAGAAQVKLEEEADAVGAALSTAEGLDAIAVALQRFLQRQVIGPVLRGELTTYPKAPLFLTKHIPALRAVPAYIVAIGPRPEHAPDFARRAN